MAKENKKTKQTFSVKAKAAFSRISKFFREVKTEIKKITWPTVPNAFKNMGITMAVIAMIGVYVFLLDLGFGKLLGLIMSM